MLRYLVQRIIQIVPVLLGVSIVVFAMLHMIPGDPAVIMAGEDASRETIQTIRESMGLDRPITVQFTVFLGRLLRGDLGKSIRTKLPVAQEITERYPYTATMAVLATVLASAVGIVAGVVAAVNRSSAIDTISMVIALLGVSTPSFWLGLMLMLVFALTLRWLPTVGASTPLHYIMPTLTLGAQSAGMIARMSRSAMLEVIRQDYVRTARAKGLSERVVIYHHALKNALIPIVTIVGLRFGGLLAGTVLVESVFNIPGIGRAMVDAVATRDYPMVQGTVLVVAASFVLVNTVVDLMYAFIDPRIRFQ